LVENDKTKTYRSTRKREKIINHPPPIAPPMRRPPFHDNHAHAKTTSILQSIKPHDNHPLKDISSRDKTSSSIERANMVARVTPPPPHFRHSTINQYHPGTEDHMPSEKRGSKCRDWGEYLHLAAKASNGNSLMTPPPHFLHSTQSTNRAHPHSNHSPNHQTPHSIDTVG
jgi:hypothetical protein